jgi:hypothetical protein
MGSRGVTNGGGTRHPSPPQPPKLGNAMFAALKAHWPEYLMEAAGLGIFMISVCVVDALLEYPLSPVHQTIRDPIVRTILRCLARGLTAVGLIYSPWGKQSGAHFNPAITLTKRLSSGASSWRQRLSTGRPDDEVPATRQRFQQLQETPGCYRNARNGNEKLHRWLPPRGSMLRI